MFTGAATAAATPMNKDFSINYDVFQQHIERQLENGISALVVCGTTGEASTLSDSEQHRLIQCAVEAAGSSLPIIAGASSNNTAHAVKLAQNAEQAGAQALLVLTPYYNKTSQSGLVRHFAAVCSAVSVPVILYNVPSRTGMGISLQSCRSLSALENVAGIKDASGDMSFACELSSYVPELTLYSGNDDLTLPMLSIGALGVISVASNLFPQKVASVCQSFFDGDTDGAKKGFLALMPVIKELFCEVNPIPLKYAMNYLGLNAGPCRMPLVELGAEKRHRLEMAIDRIFL